jgi:hypothetical protein
MKKIILMFVIGLLIQRVTQAQGTMTYLSNLGQASTGSLAIGSNSWLAAEFRTGNNASGYLLNSVQLALTDASGNPSNFTAMIYTEVGFDGDSPGSSLGRLDGSLNPGSSGVYNYTDDSSITLSPNAIYYIVLTAGTAVGNDAYEWSLTSSASYNPNGGWGWFQPYNPFHSSDGLNWYGYLNTNPQFAINATAIPEPSSEILLGLGVVFFGLVRWKAKSIA